MSGPIGVSSPIDASTHELPPGYPLDLERVWHAADGTAVRLRALIPSDLDLEMAFISGLSPETLHLRLQYSSRNVTREEAARLLDLDYQDAMAIGAFVDEPAGEALVGVSRYARLADTDRADCAIVVADRWHGRGVGTELMRSLGLAARARGLRALEATSLAENQRILEWARRFGFDARTEANSGGLVRITLELESLLT